MHDLYDNVGIDYCKVLLIKWDLYLNEFVKSAWEEKNR